MDLQKYYRGEAVDIYEYLGCHLTEFGAVFRVFAPAATAVSVTGEFNGWTDTFMQKVYDGNFWECYIDGVRECMMYKFRIHRRDGQIIDHCDPFGFGMELRPNWASVVRNLNNYQFRDENWMKKRTDCKDKPLNIYEVHLGSWKLKPQNDWQQENADIAGRWYNYPEIARQLIPYIKEKGYTHVEVMPLAEHPSDNSWGYQCTGFYSPTSRYGTVNQLKEMIDLFHQSDIGVILDFVPVHFAVDGYALNEFDGTALYEYPHSDVGVSEWGSRNFMHSRGEVQSFLQSSAYYWLKEYHFDGLRIDALSNIIYWQGNKARGVNDNAVRFIQHMNRTIKEQYPGVMLIAEDSTSYPGVTKPAEQGGLGFDYKWDMGWMNDTLDYFRLHPYDRKAAYHKLTFSMMYYYGERYLLPLSHDEVVHGKATIAQKMYGDYDGKFPQARALYMYMFAHPGKKLNFMGNELGQLREWDEKKELDWNLLQYPIHDSFARFMRDLNKVYEGSSALWEQDFTENGFQWLDCHQEEKCIYVMERKSKKQRIVAAFNFSDNTQTYELAVENAKELCLLLASDADIYSGSTTYEYRQAYKLKKGSIELELPAFSGMYFEVR